jgi:hypothetical protein
MVPLGSSISNVDTHRFYLTMQISLVYPRPWSAGSRGRPCPASPYSTPNALARLLQSLTQIFNLRMPRIRNMSFSEPWATIDVGQGDQGQVVDSASEGGPLSDERPSRPHDHGTCSSFARRCDSTLWILRSPNCDMGLALPHNFRRPFTCSYA